MYVHMYVYMYPQGRPQTPNASEIQTLQEPSAFIYSLMYTVWKLENIILLCMHSLAYSFACTAGAPSFRPIISLISR